MDAGAGWGVDGSAEDHGGAGASVYDDLGGAEGRIRKLRQLEHSEGQVRAAWGLGIVRGFEVGAGQSDCRSSTG